MAHLDTLPFQDGRPLSPIRKEGTILVDYSSNEHTSHHHVCMVEVDEVESYYKDEVPNQISADEVTVEAGNKDDAQ